MSLRELRIKRNMTQDKLAEKAGLSGGRTQVSAYETGSMSVENMTLGTALRICDALRVSNPRKLLDDDKPSKEKDAQ